MQQKHLSRLAEIFKLKICLAFWKVIHHIHRRGIFCAGINQYNNHYENTAKLLLSYTAKHRNIHHWKSRVFALGVKLAGMIYVRSTHPGCQWKVQVLSVFWVKDVLFFCHHWWQASILADGCKQDFYHVICVLVLPKSMSSGLASRLATEAFHTTGMVLKNHHKSWDIRQVI